MIKGFITIPVLLATAFVVGAVAVWDFSTQKQTKEIAQEQPFQEQSFGAFNDPFISIQLATDPDNGECLITDGTNNIWSSSCGGGGSGVFAWIDQGWGVSTSTVIGFYNGFISNASSTAIDLRVKTLNATSTLIDTLTVTNAIVGDITGNAGTATSLATNGANCPAGQYPLGVDATGAVESCTTDDTGNDTLDDLSDNTTSDLAEGTNLYFTNERVDDRVASLIQNGTGLAWTYNDAGGTLTGDVSLSAFTTDDLAEGSSNLYFTNARVADYINSSSTIVVVDDINTEADLEGVLIDVTNIYTNNDGNLTDDDLSDNNTDQLSEGSINLYYNDTRVADYIIASSTVPNVGGCALGEVIEWNGTTFICGTDDVGAGGGTGAAWEKTTDFGGAIQITPTTTASGITVTATSTFSGGNFIVNSKILQVGTNNLRYVPSGGDLSAFVIIDKPNTASDASLLLADQGDLKWEIGMAGSNNMYWKTVSGTEGSYVFDNVLYMDYTSNWVGIGTETPSGKLEIATSTDADRAALWVTNKNTGAGSDGSMVVLSSNAGAWYLYSDVGLNGGDNFGIGDGTYPPTIFIDASGNLGVKDDSLIYQFEVQGNSLFTGSATTTDVLHAGQIEVNGKYISNFVGTGLQLTAGALQTTLGVDITVGELAVADFGDWSCNGTTCTIDANAVALGTDTTGNYVATIADAGSSTITVTGSGAENAAVTLDVIDVNCTDCLNATEIADIYLLNTGDVGTGSYDFGGAQLEIPNGTAPTVDTAGEIGLDTTGNQFLISTSTAADAVVFGRAIQRIWSMNFASSTPILSGEIVNVPPETDGYTVYYIQCYVADGTSLVVNLSDGTNATNTITCDGTATTQRALTQNNVWTAGEKARIEFGTNTGNVTDISISAFGVWTRE